VAFRPASPEQQQSALVDLLVERRFGLAETGNGVRPPLVENRKGRASMSFGRENKAAIAGVTGTA
jgi:hypothetical protein